MNEESITLQNKRRRIIFIVKLFVYFLVAWMYYLFFQILLLFINIYATKYEWNIKAINSQLMLEKKNLTELKEQLNIKNKNYLSLIMNLNNKNKKIKKEQTKILSNIRKILWKDLIAYWYYCSHIKHNIIDHKNDFIVNFDNIDLTKYNFIIKKQLKKKIRIIDKSQIKFISWFNVFYKTNCNQNTWFKMLIEKYFNNSSN